MSSKKGNSNEDWVSSRYFRSIFITSFFVYIGFLIANVLILDLNVYSMGGEKFIFMNGVSIVTVMLVIDDFKEEYKGKAPEGAAVFSILLYTAISIFISVIIFGYISYEYFDRNASSMAGNIGSLIFENTLAFIEMLFSSIIVPMIYLNSIVKDEEHES